MTVGISGTGGGFERFCRDEIDLANASRPIEDDEKQLCADAGVEYVELPVANDALTVVVNPENDWATCLTVEQLKAIWEPGLDDRELAGRRPELSRRAASALRPGHRLRHVRLLHRRRRRRGGREPNRLSGLGGRQRHHRRRHRRQGRTRVLRLLVLRAEPGQGEGRGDRQRLRLRGPVRPDGAGRYVRTALAAAVRLREDRALSSGQRSPSSSRT